MFGLISPRLSLHNEARETLEAFAKVCPPVDKAAAKHKPVPEKKVAESLELLNKRIADYAQKNRLAKALQNEMNQMGYPADLVSRVVSAVTVNALVAPGRRG